VEWGAYGYGVKGTNYEFMFLYYKCLKAINLAEAL